MSRSGAIVLTLALMACAGKGQAPESVVDAVPVDAGGYDLDAPIPMDPNVRHGTLDNGLRWFIEPNGVPDDRVVLRLVVETGSVLEEEDQLGLAHFVEHMAFNGTKNFPGNSLITTLEGLGSRFGPHINAHTSFDETVYKLQLPTDDPEVVDTGFRILGDWAGGLTFEEEEIEKERGVVLEEWRQSLGSRRRIFEQLKELTFKDSRYAERLPIGTEESLQTFEPDAARRFYEDWYRPELMSVMVVGDVDPDEMQAKIEATFGDLQGPKKPRERVRPDIPPHDETLVKVVADPEVPVANVAIMHKHDMLEDPTFGGYRETLEERLFTLMFNSRMAELAQQPGAPFLGAGGGDQRRTPTEGMWAIGFSAREGDLPEATRAVWTEVQRVREHGFTEAELMRARAITLKGFEAYKLDSQNMASAQHVEELIRHATNGESVPGVTLEVALAEAWVPTIGLDEINALADDWMPDESRVVTVVVPEKEGYTPPTGEEILAILDAVEASDIEPWAEEDAVADPVQATPEPGTIVETDTSLQEALGYTRWTLSNGVVVYFRKTDFKNDEVVFRGFRLGGTRTVSDEDYIALSYADDVKRASGAGALSAAEMMKWMAGKNLSVRAWPSSTFDNVSGQASPSDLDAALSLLWQGMTDPRLTDAGRDEVLEAQRAALENRDAQPGHKMRVKMADALWPDTPRKHAWTVEEVEEALSDTERLESLYEARFGDATGFTFAFTGNLPDDFEQSVLTWLATLPTSDAEPATSDVPLAMKDGPHEVVAKVNSERKANVGLTWIVPFEDADWESRNELDALEGVLSTLLREELREERSGVYGVSVRASTESFWPARQATVAVSFTCDPDRVEELEDAALAIIDQVRTAPVDARYVEEIIAKRANSREESLESNSFWNGSMLGAIKRGEDPLAILDYDERNQAVTPEVIQAAAKRFLPTKTPLIVGRQLPTDAVMAGEGDEE